MNISCPACRSVFRVDPAKVPSSGVRARCSVCGTVLEVAAPESAHSQLAASQLAASQPDAGSAPVSQALAGVEAPAPSIASSNGPVSDVPFEAAVDGRVESDATESTPARSAEPGAARPRPVNPYLNNTPELRARRLARALVSDLVAYNPQKREEGLRDGTLRQLFRDEIRKSWDEYVEQVGASVAESTPHFQDALNDVLAGGRRVF